MRLELEPLGPCHDVDSFDCGLKAFNMHLRREAKAERSWALEKVITFVVCFETAGPASASSVVGYITLAPGVVEAALCPEAIRRRQRRQSVPAVVLVRLAVDCDWQRKGIGGDLVRQAVSRSAHGSDVFGARVVVAFAAGEGTRSFLGRSGFVPLPGDDWHLYAPMG
jgi:GNAT superfamily N-acetyltransferase